MSTHRPQKIVLETMPLKAEPFVFWWAAPAALVFTSLALMLLHRADALPVEKMRSWMTDATAPVLSALSAPLTSAIDNIDGIKIVHDLRAENLRLREENARLRQWYESALRLKAENESFRELLNVKADPEMNFVTARIISSAGSAFVKSALLPVGEEEGVTKGNAVMSGQGLVGRVTEVGRHSARVLLVTDLNSRIPALIAGTRTKGILAGKNKDLLRLERLPPDSGVAVGARVVTSGDGGQLPADIPVGIVTEVERDGVWVKPLSDISRLTHVQVVNTGAYRDLSEMTAPEDGAPKKRK